MGLVAVDYIQRVRARDMRLSRQVHLGEVIDGVKDLAQQYDLHALIPAQLNRQSEGRPDKRPLLADLREAGDLEPTADNVILLHEEDIDVGGKMQKSGEVEVVVAKARNGPTGMRTLQKRGEYAKLAQMVPPNMVGVSGG